MRSALTKFKSVKPACFTSVEQYREWKHWARMSMENVSRMGPCIDCTPEFQQEMIACKRCENPFVEFKLFPGYVKGRFVGGELKGYVDTDYVNQGRK